jgi:putative ABC transport system permease protein
MGAVRTKTLADLRRRKVQSLVIGVVLFLAATAATLALGILVESRAPFDRAFAAANGAHLIIDYRGDLPSAKVAATGAVIGVTGHAGPWTVTRAAIGHPKGGLVVGAELSARPQPDPSIDAITIEAGRWWQKPGEAVLDQDTANRLGRGVGDTIQVFAMPEGQVKGGGGGGGVRVAPQPATDPGPGRTLTVVGIAGSVSTPNVAAWTSPDDVAAVSGNRPPDLQMLYRVEASATAGDLAAATTAITAGLPANAVTSATSHLDLKAGVDRLADLYVPVLLAFAVFALLAAGFTIANTVSGIVLTGSRDIGVMKAIGFTPGQVATILVGQMLLPVVVGAGLGVVVGILASQPIIAQTAQSFGLPAAFGVSVPVVVAVILVTTLMAIGAALGPAIRAGRLTAVEAIGRGVAPSTRPDGGRLRRLGLALPVGLPARLGVAAGVAHPVRAAMTLGALVVGVLAVTFAVGVDASLLRVKEDLDRTQASPVRAEVPGSDAAEAAWISATIAADPDTGHAVAENIDEVQVPRLGAVPFVGYDGDASWVGYALIQGRWFGGAGEAVAPTAVFTQAGLHLGDTLTVTRDGRTLDLRLVGEILDTGGRDAGNLVLRGASSDLKTLSPTAVPSLWEMQPRAGIDARTYRSSLTDATNGTVWFSLENESSSDTSFVLFLTVVGFLGVVLVVTSLAGVFNTVLLETRQRSRELAILKAIGLTPIQAIGLIVVSVMPVAIVAGIVGVPLGLAAQRAVLTAMGQVAAGTAIPESVYDVFPGAMLLGLGVAGLAIGVVGAVLPAQRVARAPIAPVLAAE